MLWVLPADSDTLTVGTKVAPPFAMRDDSGSWTGISIDLWRAIADSLAIEYRLVETDLDGMLEGVASGELDIAVAALTVTPERERAFDFSHPFHSSGLGIAVHSRSQDTWLAFIRRLLSPVFLRTVGTLALLLLVVALLVWAIERRANPEQFGGTPLRGIGSGFWWSAVTMTTVGYGDKAPVTALGRMLGLVWMFAAVITISTFTASISAALTVTHFETSVEGVADLPDVSVGTATASTSARYLQEEDIRYREFPTVQQAVEELAAGRIDAVVYDAPILRYLLRQRNNNALVVLPEEIERQDYALGLPANSTLREAVNLELLKRVQSSTWERLLRRYLGDPAKRRRRR